MRRTRRRRGRRQGRREKDDVIFFFFKRNTLITAPKQESGWESAAGRGKENGKDDFSFKIHFFNHNSARKWEFAAGHRRVVSDQRRRNELCSLPLVSRQRAGEVGGGCLCGQNQVALLRVIRAKHACVPLPCSTTASVYFCVRTSKKQILN